MSEMAKDLYTSILIMYTKLYRVISMAYMQHNEFVHVKPHPTRLLLLFFILKRGELCPKPIQEN